jgi:hypothetical protein
MTDIFIQQPPVICQVKNNRLPRYLASNGSSEENG